jgi:hypothetical protein
VITIGEPSLGPGPSRAVTGGGEREAVAVQRENEMKGKREVGMHKDEQRCLHPQEASLDARGLV